MQLKEITALQNVAMHQNGMVVSPPPYGIGYVDNLRERENRTGLPDNLKAGIENLSGLAMDDVRVHYNSSKPAEMQALAYTQGTDIHVGPGQEQHLPHEAWHVVQQKQERVKGIHQFNGSELNNDVALEEEANLMGSKVNSTSWNLKQPELTNANPPHNLIVQRFKGSVEDELYNPDDDDYEDEYEDDDSLDGEAEVYLYDKVKHPAPTLGGYLSGPLAAIERKELSQKIHSILAKSMSGLKGKNVKQYHTLTVEQLVEVIFPYLKDIKNTKGALEKTIEYIKHSENIEQAEQALKQIRDFKFNPEFATFASANAREYAERDRNERLKNIEDEKQNASEKALSTVLDQAKKELDKSATRKQKLGKEQMPSENKTKVLSKQEELASEKLSEINASAEMGAKKINETIFPETYKSQLNDYRMFFEQAKYHPDTLVAFKVAENDFGLALKIINALGYDQHGGKVKSFLLQGGLAISELRRCLLADGMVICNILNRIHPDVVKRFLFSDARWDLFQSLFHTNNVPPGNIERIAQHLNIYSSFIEDTVAKASLIRLASTYTVDDINAWLASLLENNKAAKLNLLVSLRPKAQSAADFKTCLEICKQASWVAAQVQHALNGAANGSTLLVLKGLIYTALDGEFNKDVNFGGWVKNLGVLVSENYYTIVCHAVGWLPHKPSTYEWICKVNRNAQEVFEFVLHYHPDGEKATVASPNSSKLHIKPERGSATSARVYQDLIPKSIWHLIKPLNLPIPPSNLQN